MDIPLVARACNEAELRTLRLLKSSRYKQWKQPLKYHYMLGLALAAAGAFWLMTVVSVKFIKVILGWIVALTGYVALYYPYLALKKKRKARACLQRLDSAIAKAIVASYVVHAKRIARSPEFKDESDLYIIEYESGKVLYFYDYNYQLTKKGIGRCLEIYESEFAELLGREVYHYGERVTLIPIDSQSKWIYFSERGAPGHLTTEVADFDQLVAAYNSFANNK